MHWLVYNASAHAQMEDGKMRNLLSYVSSGMRAEGDELIDDICARMDALNHEEEVMAMIFTMQDEIELQADFAFERGEERGRAEGLAEGLVEGEARSSKLLDRLFAADRIDDAKRVTIDPAYRARLFAEFGLA